MRLFQKKFTLNIHMCYKFQNFISAYFYIYFTYSNYK